MKKYLITILLTAFSVSAIAQTGTGWAQQRSKVNFKDSINIANGWMIKGTIILPSAAEINYVDGVTSAIQTQINLKANLASPNFTGTPTAPTAADGTNSTQIATTAFVESGFATIGELAAQKYFDYDYYVEEVAGTVYARRSPNTSLTSYSGATLSGVLNSAMSQLTSGGIIYIEYAEYADMDSVRFPYSNIKIISHDNPKPVFKLKANFDALKSLYGTNGFFAAIDKSGIEIRGIEFDGNGANQTHIDNNNAVDGIVGRSHGITFTTAGGTRPADCIIEDCYIHDFAGAAGIVLQGNYITVRNCRVVDNYSNQITLGAYTDWNVVEGCYLKGGGDVGIAIMGSNNIFRNSTVRDAVGLQGTTGSMTTILLEGNTGAVGLNHNNVIENVFVRNPGGSIGIGSYYGGKNNIIRSCDVDSVTKASGVALYFSGDTSLLIDNCTVGKSNNYGIALVGCLNPVVKDTYVNSNAVTGALFLGDFDPGTGAIYTTGGKFYNNSFLNPAGYGVQIEASCDNNYFVGNVLEGTGFNADFSDGGIGNKKNYNYGIYAGDWLNTDGLFSSLEIGDQTSNTMASLDSLGIVDSKIASYIDADTTDYYTPYAYRVNLDDVAVLNTDTAAMLSPYIMATEVENSYVAYSDTADMLAPYALTSEVATSSNLYLKSDRDIIHTFNTGYNTAHDTMFFETGSILGAFFNRSADTLVVTDVISSISLGDTLSWHILYADTLNDADVGDYTHITDTISMDGGAFVETETFENDTVPPNKWVYAKAIATTNTENPVLFAATMTGYKIKGTFDNSLTGIDSAQWSSEYKTAYYSFATPPALSYADWQNDMVYSLDSLGAWDRFRAFYMFATNDSADSYINWAIPGTDNATATAADFTAYRGFNGNGSSAYINTNYNPSSTDTLDLLTGKNNLSLGIYLREDIAVDLEYVIGASATGTYISFRPRRLSSAELYMAVNSASTLNAASANSSGLFILTRRAFNNTEAFYNGSSVEAPEADLSAINSYSIYLLRNGAYYSNNEVACFFIMNGISEAEDDAFVAAVNTIIERYLDRVGAGVE